MDLLLEVASWVLSSPLVLLVGLLNWRNPGMEYITGSDIYDINFGQSGPAATGGYEGMLLGNQQHWRGPAQEASGTFQGTSGYGQSYLAGLQAAGFGENGPMVTPVSSQGNWMFNTQPQAGRLGGGASPGGGASSGSSGGLAPQAAQPVQVGSQLSTASLGGGAVPVGTSTAPVISGGAMAGGGGAAAGAAGAAGTAGSTAATTAATPWWKAALGNKALMSGVVSAAGTAYGQYQQKSQAKDAYKWQQGELEARRAYEEEKLRRRQNSPFAQMVPQLQAMAIALYGDRLRKRGLGANLDAILAMIPNSGGA